MSWAQFLKLHWEVLAATDFFTVEVATWQGLMTYLSLSRLNHGLPGTQAHPEVMQGTTEFHHQIADTFFP
jgi:hypothetical protein